MKLFNPVTVELLLSQDFFLSVPQKFNLNSRRLRPQPLNIQVWPSHAVSCTETQNRENKNQRLVYISLIFNVFFLLQELRPLQTKLSNLQSDACIVTVGLFWVSLASSSNSMQPVGRQWVNRRKQFCYWALCTLRSGVKGQGVKGSGVRGQRRSFPLQTVTVTSSSQTSGRFRVRLKSRFIWRETSDREQTGSQVNNRTSSCYSEDGSDGAELKCVVSRDTF